MAPAPPRHAAGELPRVVSGVDGVGAGHVQPTTTWLSLDGSASPAASVSAALKAAMRGGRVNVIVTDVATARSLANACAARFQRAELHA